MKKQNMIIEKWKNIIFPDNIEISDIIVAKFKTSDVWNIPWENWHHAWLISEINWDEIKIIEAPWKITKPPTWPIEKNIKESLFWRKDLIELLLLKPKFSKIIRKKGSWHIPTIFKKKLSEKEARSAVIKYARNQIWEEYTIWTTKWNDKSWYCSKLVFKSYSMTLDRMYLESYDFPSLWILPVARILKTMSFWFYVTPEDLVDSKRTVAYYNFIKE